MLPVAREEESEVERNQRIFERVLNESTDDTNNPHMQRTANVVSTRSNALSASATSTLQPEVTDAKSSMDGLVDIYLLTVNNGAFRLQQETLESIKLRIFDKDTPKAEGDNLVRRVYHPHPIHPPTERSKDS